MSSSDRRSLAGGRPVARLALGVALCAALGLTAACNVRPLYASRTGGSLAMAGPTDLAALRGRIIVAPVLTRTPQIVRNTLLTELNNGAVAAGPPLYEIGLDVTGLETVTSIQEGSGIPSASSFRVTVKYQVRRLADAKVIAKGTRFAVVPFDRSRQLFASSRAVLDAREQAGEEAGRRVALAVSAILAKDAATGPLVSDPRAAPTRG